MQIAFTQKVVKVIVIEVLSIMADKASDVNHGRPEGAGGQLPSISLRVKIAIKLKYYIKTPKPLLVLFFDLLG